MEREPQPLSALLQHFLKESGLEEALLLARLPELWAEVVGTPAARVSTLRHFAAGELIVEVSVPAWRLELQLRCEELRRRLNERLGHELVRKLVIR